jgi:hypothetical protein
MKTRMCPSESSAPGRLGHCSRIPSWPAAICRTERPDTRPHTGGIESNYLAKPGAFTHGHMTAFVPPPNSCNVALESRAVPHMTQVEGMSRVTRDGSSCWKSSFGGINREQISSNAFYRKGKPLPDPNAHGNQSPMATGLLQTVHRGHS